MQALNSVNTLGYRLMVGQRPLKPLIGVRIPVSQPSFGIRFFAKIRSEKTKKRVMGRYFNKNSGLIRSLHHLNVTVG